MAHLTIVARYCDNVRIYEELCCLIPFTNMATGQDVLTAFVNLLENQVIDIIKLFCITSDGARAMVGKEKGFVNLLENHIGCSVMSFNCFIHQKNLVAKISSQSLSSVMETVVKIVNLIVSRSSLTHRQSKSLLQELDSEYADLILHSNVRWLSRGNVLNRFVSCLEEIKIFLEEKRFSELDNEDGYLN
ncbi:general transcription factor II-I repeat domain-containing protein 2A-like [Octopus sinensis]|uniref:General transcription factor II-I repeat domain-containing protein 2A-like n=1 Tax=Octopus sinensis TaxID=2607531 RepID=A0A6P7SBS7_9MOLL|nr:general transcription factor II-I repeat domain-containing protein 2A-like [Octopus sinensis]